MGALARKLNPALLMLDASVATQDDGERLVEQSAAQAESSHLK